MANRLSAVIGSYVHKGRTGLIMGRYFKDNIRKVTNIINKHRQNKSHRYCYFPVLKRRLIGLSGKFALYSE